MSGQGFEQLTLFPADSPASHLVLPGSEEARTMTATSGRKCLELYRKSGPLGSLVRMLVGSSEWVSTRRYLTWRPQATKQGRLYFRLVPLTPPTDVIDALLLPTPTRFDADCGDLKGKAFTGTRHAMKLIQAVKMWPTPSASDAGRTKINPHMTKNGTVRHIGKTGGQSYARLDQVVAMFPTPRARDGKDTLSIPPSRVSELGKDSLSTRIARDLLPTPKANCGTGPSNCETRQGSPDLQTACGGTLNPDWVEWLMAFPPGWTDIG